jgi:hypothetical protein
VGCSNLKEVYSLFFGEKKKPKVIGISRITVFQLHNQNVIRDAGREISLWKKNWEISSEIKKNFSRPCHK